MSSTSVEKLVTSEKRAVNDATEDLLNYRPNPEMLVSNANSVSEVSPRAYVKRESRQNLWLHIRFSPLLFFFLLFM